MGPHSKECGDPETGVTTGTPFALLQWGRTQKSAETEVSRMTSAALLSLQWGRTQKSAETMVARSMTGKVGCFNGAALKRVRRRHVDLSRFRGRGE